MRSPWAPGPPLHGLHQFDRPCDTIGKAIKTNPCSVIFLGKRPHLCDRCGKDQEFLLDMEPAIGD